MVHLAIDRVPGPRQQMNIKQHIFTFHRREKVRQRRLYGHRVSSVFSIGAEEISIPLRDTFDLMPHCPPVREENRTVRSHHGGAWSVANGAFLAI